MGVSVGCNVGSTVGALVVGVLDGAVLGCAVGLVGVAVGRREIDGMKLSVGTLEGADEEDGWSVGDSDGDVVGITDTVGGEVG